MDYQKVSVVLTPDSEDNRAILMSQMADAGFESFVENDKSVDAFIPAQNWSNAMLNQLEVFGLFSIEWQAELVPDCNWNQEWEKNYFKPLLLAERCVVRAPFHTDYPKAEFELVIEPNMAFGTGNHETTSLMAEKILTMDFAQKTVLDMGCGTGILAMLASKLGANKVTAIDIDQWAYEGTIENCQINNCNNVVAYLGDASLLNEQKFDVVFANIHKNVLLTDMEAYCQVLKQGGEILMSGFYLNDLTDINQKAHSIGFESTGFIEKNNWVVAFFRKNEI